MINIKFYFDYLNDEDFLNLINPIISSQNFLSMKNIKQHNSSNVYIHSILVAYNCYKRALNYHSIDLNVLVRGALLHDYYLYDWRVNKNRTGIHGFSHPKHALKNALDEYDLTIKEIDIILNHMWPLTLFSIPKSKEAWLVSLIDKFVAFYEIICTKKIKNLKIAIK